MKRVVIHKLGGQLLLETGNLAYTAICGVQKYAVNFTVTNGTGFTCKTCLRMAGK